MFGGIAARAYKSQGYNAGWLLSGAIFLFLQSAAADPPDGIRAERYEMDVSFQPEKSFLHARAAITLKAIQSLESIELELNPHLKILEVTDPAGRKLEFLHSGRLGSPKLSVRLAEPSVVNQATTLTFVYEGVLPQQALDYITSDGILLRDESRWYPAVDLSAFTQNDITIRLPDGWEGLSSGELVGVGDSERLHYGQWKTPRPVSSRSVAAYPRTRWGGCNGPAKSGAAQNEPSRPAVQLCAPRDHDASHQAILLTAQEALNIYGGAFGPYRNHQFILIEGFPAQSGAIGYSAPGFLVISADAVNYHDDADYAPGFLPHEIAHQWFPIEVTLARQEDGWLAESLAEYLAWRYLREKNSEQARRMVSRAMRDTLAHDPLRPLALGLRLFGREDESVVRETLYQRGMLVWRTLETVIGRERVDRALAEYSKRHRGESASVSDFRQICEEVAGRNLGWFFDYFLNGTQVPEIELRRTPSNAPHEVSGEIILKNVPEDLQVRVEMRVETLSGAFDHSFATRGLVTPFTLTSEQPVTRITVDPEARILRWTEAGRRNRRQQSMLAELGALERAGDFGAAAGLCSQALRVDPEDLAGNAQPIHFALGRLRYRMKQYVASFSEMTSVLTLDSLDPMDTDFNRAWARVYRARIEKLHGRVAAARAEARAGLALKTPALETPVAWPETYRASRAIDELRALASGVPFPGALLTRFTRSLPTPSFLALRSSRCLQIGNKATRPWKKILACTCVLWRISHHACQPPGPPRGGALVPGADRSAVAGGPGFPEPAPQRLYSSPLPCL